jgi:hypothetical protein
MGTQRQQEIGHFQAKVGDCPFCQKASAELWYEPDEDWQPYQVRCRTCGARGPWADCGWESAVPSWDMVGRRDSFTPEYRGPEDEDETPTATPSDTER